MDPRLANPPWLELRGAPAPLVLAAVLLAVMLVLLARRGRTRERALPVPTLETWRSALARARPHRRPRRPPWLLLQLAAIALLGAAALDPRPTPERFDGRHLVIAIETSAAMALPARGAGANGAAAGGVTRLAAARALAREHLAALGAADRVALVAFASDARLCSGFSDGPEAARARLDALAADGGPAHEASARRLADALLAGRPRAQLLLLRAADFGPTGNLALVGFGARRRPPPVSAAAAEEPVDLVATVRNLGPGPVTASVVVRGAAADGADRTGAAPEARAAPPVVLARATLTLPPGEQRGLALLARAPAAATRLVAEIEAAGSDNLIALDDRAELELPARRPVRVLALGERNLYLEGALLALGDVVEVARASGEATAAALAAEDWDLVIADAPLPGPPSPGPGYLLLGGHPVPGHFPYRAAGLVRAPVVSEVRASPLLDGLGLRDVNLAYARQVRPAPGVEVLASGFGVPLVLAAPGMLALTFDVRRSDLPLRPAWPLLLGNVLEHLARRPPAHGVAAELPVVFDLGTETPGPRAPLPRASGAPLPWRALALLALLGVLAMAVLERSPRAAARVSGLRVLRLSFALAAVTATLAALTDPRWGAAPPPRTRFVVAPAPGAPESLALAAGLAAELRARGLGEVHVAPAPAAVTSFAQLAAHARAVAGSAGPTRLFLVSEDALVAPTPPDDLGRLQPPGQRLGWVRRAPPRPPIAGARLRVLGTPRLDAPLSIEVAREDVADEAGARAALVLLRDGRPVEAPDLALADRLREVLEGRPGAVEIPLRLGAPAPVLFELAQVAPPRPVARLLVVPAAAPSVLVVSDQLHEVRAFAAALRAQKLRVEVHAPDPGLEAVLGPGRTSPHDLVVLANLPATALPAATWRALARWVDEGGGLLVTGGPASFAAGGYADSPLAPVLPVTVHERLQRERDTLALALVLDRSGSMSGTKLELLRQAARKVALALRPDDAIAVIAFDSRPEVLVRLQPASNRRHILAQLDRLTAGGGTSILPAVREGYNQLLSADATARHLIVLSDGQSGSSGLRALAQDIEQADMTLSAIGVGAGADRSLLQELAELGRGRFHHVEDETTLPRAFARELAELRPPSPPEQGLRARPAQHAQVLEGVSWGDAPPLRGHNPGRPRSGARTLLRLQDGSPLLVQWQHGLGRVATLHTDLGARWASAWLRWPQVARFWAQLARATMRPSEEHAAELEVHDLNHEVRVALDLGGTGDDGLGLHGEVRAREWREPAARALVAPLTERRPGRYEADLDLPTDGAWLLEATLRAGRARADGHPASGPRYLARGAVTRIGSVTLGHTADQLARAIARGGGIVIPTDEAATPAAASAALRAELANLPDDALQVPPAQAPLRRRLAPWLLLVALAFFVATVLLGRAIRRVPIGPPVGG